MNTALREMVLKKFWERVYSELPNRTTSIFYMSPRLIDGRSVKDTNGTT